MKGGTILGDFGHNIRCALDLLIASLTDLPIDDLNNRRHLQFPIYDHPTGYATNVPKRNRLMQVAAARQDIIERYQPYHAPSFLDDPLSLLREFNDADKHRVFHLMIALGKYEFRMTNKSDVGPRNISGGKLFMPGFSYEVINDGVISEQESPIARLQVGQLDADINSEMALTIQFGPENSRLHGRDVIPTLGGIRDRVEKVVREFQI